MPQLKEVLERAGKLAIPTSAERDKVNSLVAEVLEKVSAEIKKQKLRAKILVGGSIAKGTWLPGISDIDFFIVFDYKTFSERNAELSNFAEKFLKKVFRNLQRLHGSRDYFSANYKGYDLEFVPVLDISKSQQAKNITDFSPLHITWVVKNAKNKNDIRLAKQFMKAAGVYGAESYISGFSGHVADILVAYYSSFEKLLRAAAKWKARKILDPQRHYKSKQGALKKLNASKITGPLIIIDPVEPNRNAAAAICLEKFNEFSKAAKKFLANPSPRFFEEKIITLKNLESKKRDRKLIVFETKTPRGKKDIVGARMKSLFETLQKKFVEEDFIAKEASWQFGPKTLFWFYFDSAPLAATKLHFGPPANLAEEHTEKFRKAWKGKKIFVKSGRYAVELKRAFARPEQLAESICKDDKKIKILKS